MNILIGTSGYSYDDWKGFFYPSRLKRSDMLGYYASCFPAVEINSTYYGMPRPESMLQMTRRVPEGFLFTLKAHADMTHSQQFQPEAFARFREALEPLRDSGRLGCVLAQFPGSFHRSRQNEAYLATFREELPETPVVVEFRSATWVKDEIFERLRELQLGFCCVDEPRLAGLMPPVVAATSPVGYVRFHGRNAEKWWQHDEAYERYDYLYREDELREWTSKVEALAAQTERTFVFFNTCQEGKSGQNARDFARLLRLPLPEPPQQTLDLEPG